MNVFPASLPARALSLVLGAACAGSPVFAQAQDGGPARLIPMAPTTAPLSATPTPGSTALPQPTAARRGGVPQGFTAAPLPEIGVESSGLLDAQAGGLGEDMWRGSSRARIESWLPQLPPESQSPAVRDLMRRLLLTAATAPARAVAGQTVVGSARGGLLGLRAERLLTMGDREAAEALARSVGDRARDPLLAEVHVDALLLSGDNSAACRQARNSIRGTSSHYLQKTIVFCQALDGERDKALLGLELLQEQAGSVSEGKQAAEDLFVTMIEMIGEGDKGTVSEAEALRRPTPLMVAMFGAVGQSLPSGTAERADLGLLGAILEKRTPPVAGTGEAKPDRLTRIRAAERGVAAGVVDPPVLHTRYNDVVFEELDPARVLSERDSGYSPELRALIFQSLNKAADAGQQAQLLAMQLRLARKHGHYLLAVRSAEDHLAAIPPSPDMLWFAGEGARGMYALQRVGEGRAWFELLQRMVAPGSQGDRVATRLWPLVLLADNDAPGTPDPDRLRAWWEIQQNSFPRQEADRRAALLFAIMDGFEAPLDGLDWQPLMADSRRAADAMPDTAIWRTLAAASYDGRTGETVLGALAALDEASPGGELGRVNAMVLREALFALRRVGLEDEARAIAFDVALAAGF